jgi:hypothetical protein
MMGNERRSMIADAGIQSSWYDSVPLRVGWA